MSGTLLPRSKSFLLHGVAESHRIFFNIGGGKKTETTIKFQVYESSSNHGWLTFQDHSFFREHAVGNIAVVVVVVSTLLFNLTHSYFAIVNRIRSQINNSAAFQNTHSSVVTRGWKSQPFPTMQPRQVVSVFVTKSIYRGNML